MQTLSRVAGINVSVNPVIDIIDQTPDNSENPDKYQVKCFNLFFTVHKSSHNFYFQQNLEITINTNFEYLFVSLLFKFVKCKMLSEM